jgi:hypothetical protein
MSANVQGIPTPVKWVPRGKWERRFDEAMGTGLAALGDLDDGDTGPVSETLTDSVAGLAASGDTDWLYTLVDSGDNPEETVAGIATTTTTSNGATLVECSGAPNGETIAGTATVTTTSSDTTLVRSGGDPDETCAGLAAPIGTQYYEP